MLVPRRGVNGSGQDYGVYLTLFEGNTIGQVCFDDYHGGNAYNTVFRCWSLAWSSATSNATNNREAIDLQKSTYDANLVANVLGDTQHPDTTDIAYEGKAKASGYVEGNFSIKSGAPVGSATLLSYRLRCITALRPPRGHHYCFQLSVLIAPPVNDSIPDQVRYNCHTL